LATSQQRAQPRKAGTTKAAKAPAARKAPATAKKAVAAKKAAPKKAGPKSAGTKPGSRKVPVKALAEKAGAPKAPARSATKNRVKPSRTADAAERLRALVRDALEDLKAKDIQEIDVRGKSSVTDLMVVVSGTSSRHVKSIAEEVVKKSKQAGIPPIGVEGQREAEWVLVDLGDVIVHVMLPRVREFYGLERLWTVGDDAPTYLAG
jgi:ribosome silencing factor RsfS/YbeB/iojap